MKFRHEIWSSRRRFLRLISTLELSRLLGMDLWVSPAAIVTACLMVALAYLAIPSKQARAVMHLPKPAGYLPILGNTLLVARVQLSGRFHDWVFANCCKWRGKRWCMHILTKEPTVFVCSPEAYEDVQRTQYDAFGKNPLFTEASAEVLGQGVLAITGPLWQHQRKLAGRVFSPAMIQHAMDVVVAKKCERLIQRLDAAAHQDNRKDRVVSLKWLLDLYTMDVFCKIGFGIEISGLETPKVVAVLESMQRSSVRIVARILEPAWYWKMKRFLCVGAEKQLVSDLKRVNDMIYTAISRSIEEISSVGIDNDQNVQMNLISIYLDDATRNEEPTNLKKLRDFLMSFLAAGQDTTSTAMSWFVLMMNRHPRVLGQVRQEIKQHLPMLANGSPPIPTLEECHHLVYLEAAIRETLRLFPVAPISGRTATRNVTLSDGTFLVKGTSVHMPHFNHG